MSYYVMQRGAAHYYAETLEAAIDWATGCAPRKPPKGFKWEVWSNAGERVAVVRYNPLPQIERAASSAEAAHGDV